MSNQILPTKATVLMVFAAIVGSVRFMLLHAVAVDFELWEWFGTVEVLSGVAFAALEGIALAYVSRRWRRLEPHTWTGWLYWVILAFGQLVLLLSITWTTGMAFVSTRRELSIDLVLGPTMAAAWSMLVAGINPLIVLLIGIVEDEEGVASPSSVAEIEPAGHGLDIPVAMLAQVFINKWAVEKGKEPTPPEFTHYFEIATGHTVAIDRADEFILAWRRENGVQGRRPTLATMPLPVAAVNGNGNGVA